MTDNRIPVGDKHPNVFKTLELLRVYDRAGEPIYLIVEGCAVDDGKPISDAHEFFYEENTCPSNVFHNPAVFTADDDDPHGVFEYVATAWMTTDYVEADDEGQADAFLRALFPQTRIGREERAAA